MYANASILFHAEMNPKDVYADFNVELVEQLKLKDPIFIARLTKQRLFFGELKAKVREQSTEAEASSLFLQEAIERSLETNDAEPFMKLCISNGSVWWTIREIVNGDEEMFKLSYY